MKKTLHWLDENLEEFLLVVMLAAMTLIMGIQIFSRYALGQSLSWSEEVTRFLFIWSGFLSVSYCSKKCLSIKIEQFVAAFPRRGKALFKVVNHTFELIFFLYMIPFAYSYMMSAIHSGQLSPACGIPMYYIQAAPFVSFLLVTFRILQRWIIEFKVARGEDVYDPAHPERNTPESFIHANADMPEKESNEIESLIEANTPSGKEDVRFILVYPVICLVTLVAVLIGHSQTLMIAGAFIIGWAGAGGLLQIVTSVCNMLFPKIKGTVTALVMIASSLCNYTILTAASKMAPSHVMIMNIILTAIGVLLGLFVNARYAKMVSLAESDE